jgi:NAD(P)-dependent dehydrogenase (short-subunit alcohol dehydrogenase family)
MPSVLITGAARGIGRSIAEHLAGRGWDVIAGVRTEADALAVAAASPRRITAVILDVTNDEHIAALVAALPARLDGIVNNAGIAVSGPIETVTTEDWRKQLEVNVIGALAVTRAVLPRLRESRGRIVFISSVNGRLSMPMVGAYSASKFALEAAADALRMELARWHISVSLVEPAQTDTDMWRTADTMVTETVAALTPEHRALYAGHIDGMKKFVRISQRMAGDPAMVSAAVEKAPRLRWR